MTWTSLIICGLVFAAYLMGYGAGERRERRHPQRPCALCAARAAEAREIAELTDLYEQPAYGDD